MKRLVLLPLLLLDVPVDAAAPTPAMLLDQALSSYSAHDYAAATPRFTALAQRGSAIAETMLGVMFAHGEGVAADPATAASYWYRAANRGYAPAQLALAQALAAGAGVDRNAAQAWLWAQLAVRYGDATVANAARGLVATVQPQLDPDALEDLHKELDAWQPWPSAAP